MGLQYQYQVHSLCFGKVFFTCVSMHIYMYIFKKSYFFQNTIFEFGIGIATSIIGLAFIAFWKRALYMYDIYHMHACYIIYIINSFHSKLQEKTEVVGTSLGLWLAPIIIH